MKRFICASLFLYTVHFTLNNLLLNYKSSVTGDMGKFSSKITWSFCLQSQVSMSMGRSNFFKSWGEVHFFKIYPLTWLM